jgi:hypothetical protein
MVVRQPDHGTQTGLFAQAWGNEDIPALTEQRRSAELAATHHDDGWAIWERHPTLSPETGQPVQFLALSPLEHVPLYRAGIERAVQIDPRAGLLVSMHGAGLYNDRYGTFRLAEQHFNDDERAIVDEFLTDMADLQTRLAGPGEHQGHISTDRAALARYLLLQVWDRLSLQFVFRLAADGVIAPLPRGEEPFGELVCRNTGTFTMELEPYPFVQNAMTFPIVAVTVPDIEYRAPEEFLEAMSTATATTLECRTVRASTS